MEQKDCLGLLIAGIDQIKAVRGIRNSMLL